MVSVFLEKNWCAILLFIMRLSELGYNTCGLYLCALLQYDYLIANKAACRNSDEAQKKSISF